jgi:TonB family protein
VGGRIAPPRPLEQPPPRYSEAARRARIQGPVVLALILGEDGRVASLEVVRGLPFGLSEAAAEAVARWRYEPATLGGRPVKVRMTVTVNFELS